MHFDFTEDQYALAAATRDLLAGECPPSAVREAWDSATGRNPARWKKLADVGIVGLTVPEEHGGLGMDEVDLVLILEEAGRAALPEPLLETTAIGVPLLVEGGTDDQQARWLPRIAAGEAIVAVALAESVAGPGGPRPPLPFVADAHVADLLLLEHDRALHAVPADRFRATAQPSQDGARRLFTVEADTGDDTRMAGGPAEAARAFERGAAGTAALLNGISQRLLEMTVAYTSQREQFGRPVGSFQAVKHKLAETKLVVETSRPAAWYAAYALAEDRPDQAVAVSVAKSYAADAGHKANYEALQLHGGIGFTWEHDLHLWLKRGKALEAAYGSATWHRRRLADHLLA